MIWQMIPITLWLLVFWISVGVIVNELWWDPPE